MKYLTLIVLLLSAPALSCQPPRYPENYVPPTLEQELETHFRAAAVVYTAFVTDVNASHLKPSSATLASLESFKGTPLPSKNISFGCCCPQDLSFESGAKVILFLNSAGAMIHAVPIDGNEAKRWSVDASKTLAILRKLARISAD